VWLVENATPEQCSEKQGPAKEDPQQLIPISCAVHGLLKGTEGMGDRKGSGEVSRGKLMYFP